MLPAHENCTQTETATPIERSTPTEFSGGREGKRIQTFSLVLSSTLSPQWHLRMHEYVQSLLL